MIYSYQLFKCRIGEYGNYPSFWLGLVYTDGGNWNWLDGHEVDVSITYAIENDFDAMSIVTMFYQTLGC